MHGKTTLKASDVYQLSALKDKARRIEEEGRNTYKMAIRKSNGKLPL
jgi:hypothetical protein